MKHETATPDHRLRVLLHVYAVALLFATFMEGGKDSGKKHTQRRINVESDA
jgi:hypothetical protein